MTLRIVFFGTPQFSADTLDFLLKAGCNVVGVISKPDKPKGRSLNLAPTAIKELMLQKYPNIPLLQPLKISDPINIPALEAFDADLFVVVAYGEILRDHVLNMPKVACINVHTSLLPLYRGAAPIQRAIINGEKETGVSIMHLSKKMDEGDIISQTRVIIEEDMTYGELQDKLLQAGCPALLQAIQDLANSSSKRLPQDHEKATLAPKVELEGCEILFSKPASQLHNLIRGTNPEPGAWCYVDVKGKKLRLKIFKSRLKPNLEAISPGTPVTWGKGGMTIACSSEEPFALELLEIQLEGKKRMQAHELMNGLSKEHIVF